VPNSLSPEKRRQLLTKRLKTRLKLEKARLPRKQQRESHPRRKKRPRTRKKSRKKKRLR